MDYMLIQMVYFYWHSYTFIYFTHKNQYLLWFYFVLFYFILYKYIALLSLVGIDTLKIMTLNVLNHVEYIIK